MRKLTVDDLCFEVRWSGKRKTVEITVDRGGELRIAAPEGCDRTVLEEFIRKKRYWIYTKLADKDALRRSVVTKEFVSGAGFPYLGRSYRLLLVDNQDAPLKLDQGRFRLPRAEQERGRVHFVRWYSEHATTWLRRRIGLYAPRVGVEPTGLDVRDLGFRWGSCSQDGTINFHWAAILLPPSVVEYIVVHELVHLHEGHHTPEFWRRVERAMPDYERRKKWLAETGAEFAAGW